MGLDEAGRAHSPRCLSDEAAEHEIVGTAKRALRRVRQLVARNPQKRLALEPRRGQACGPTCGPIAGSQRRWDRALDHGAFECALCLSEKEALEQIATKISNSGVFRVRFDALRKRLDCELTGQAHERTD